MKFDIVRAWKDEIYRQSLSEEQVSLAPANPAGNLSDIELASVYGGGWGGGFGGLGIAGSSTSNAVSAHGDYRWHSLAVAACDTNVFSAVQTITPVTPLLSPIKVVCASIE